MTLHRFWFEFAVPDPPAPKPGAVQLDGEPWAIDICRRGVGVAAYDEDDALHLIIHEMCERQPPPPITSVTRDVDVSTLEDRFWDWRVGVPVWRGIWFPGWNLRGPQLRRRT